MYKISGFDCDLRNFKYTADSFVQAMKVAKKLESELCCVFLCRADSKRPIRFFKCNFVQMSSP